MKIDREAKAMYTYIGDTLVVYGMACRERHGLIHF
jgi:hypothetical protein